MDISRAVQEQQPRACERVVGFSGDFKDANVVVSGLEPGKDFDVLDGNPVVLGLGCGGGVVDLLGLGC